MILALFLFIQSQLSTFRTNNYYLQKLIKKQANNIKNKINLNKSTIKFSWNKRQIKI